METTMETTATTLKYQFLLNNYNYEALICSGIRSSSHNHEEVLQKIQQENGGILEPC
jgi:hypothetical protein